LDSPYYLEDTLFYSEGDEQALFGWIDEINCIQNAYGRVNRMFLVIDEEKMTRDNYWELVAIYRRYGGDLAQFKVFDAKYQ
jgi:hypothetical protein